MRSHTPTRGGIRDRGANGKKRTPKDGRTEGNTGHAIRSAQRSTQHAFACNCDAAPAGAAPTTRTTNTTVTSTTTVTTTTTTTTVAVVVVIGVVAVEVVWGRTFEHGPARVPAVDSDQRPCQVNPLPYAPQCQVVH